MTKPTKPVQLNWRLKTLPTIDELRDLITDEVISKDEARSILFSTSQQDEAQLAAEITFLKELVKQLTSKLGSQVTFSYSAPNYPRWVNQPWFSSYGVVGTSGTAGSIMSINTSSLAQSLK